MIDWLKQMVIFSKGGLPTIAENLSFYGTRTGTLTLLDYYLMTYEALQVVVQRKQLELDSIAEVNNLAIDYYGIWGIGSIEGPFRLFLKQNTWWPKLNIQALTEYTEEELATKIGKPRYFIKLVHEHK